MKRLSYILPCYNVEQYIGDCLDSLFHQGLAESDFEIICVDDCSTDGTRELITTWKSRHPDTVILLEQPRNMYPGAARNRGFSVAEGEYVWFVDADDLLKPTVAGCVLKELDEGALDFLLFNFDECPEADPQTFIERKDFYGNWSTESGLSFLASHFNNNLRTISLVWLGVFRRSFLQTNQIVFPDLYMSEDSLFLWQAFFCAQAVRSIDKRLYIHRVNSFSIIQTPPTARKNYCCSFLLPVALKEMEVRYAGTVPQAIMDRIMGYFRHELNQFAVRYLQLSADDRKKYFSMIRADKHWFRRFRPFLSRKNRLIYRSSLLGERVFARMAQRMLRQ